jgi:hypothetical protein
LELALFTAWQTARLSHYTGGKLSSLNDYLRELKPPRPQTNADRIAAMRAIMATMGTAPDRRAP